MNWLTDVIGSLTDPNKPMTAAELIGWVAAIATAVATVVTAAVSFWFRNLDQPRARFEIIPIISDWYYSEGDLNVGSPSYTIDISNVGTGPARLVSFIGFEAILGAMLEKKPLEQGHLALMEPGQTVRIDVNTISTRWKDARVLVTWSEPRSFSPWSKRKWRSFKISDSFTERQLVMYMTDPVTGVYGETRTTPGPEVRKQIQQQDKELEEIGDIVRAKPRRLANQLLMRRLSKAGWLWRQKLTRQTLDEANL